MASGTARGWARPPQPPFPASRLPGLLRTIKTPQCLECSARTREPKIKTEEAKVMRGGPGATAGPGIYLGPSGSWQSRSRPLGTARCCSRRRSTLGRGQRTRAAAVRPPTTARVWCERLTVVVGQVEVALEEPVAERHPPNCEQVVQSRDVGPARVRHPPLPATVTPLRQDPGQNLRARRPRQKRRGRCGTWCSRRRT